MTRCVALWARGRAIQARYYLWGVAIATRGLVRALRGRTRFPVTVDGIPFPLRYPMTGIDGVVLTHGEVKYVVDVLREQGVDV